MFLIEVYSSEANRWYLWMDAVKPANLDNEIARAKRLYEKYRVVRSAP